MSALCLAGLRIPLSARYPQPEEALAVHVLVIVQITAAALLFPLLFRSITSSIIVIASAIPFIQLAAVGIPMLETRNDDKPTRRGISRGYSVTGGIAFNLDWIGRKDAWEQYDSNQVLHTYLTFQLEYLRTLSGPVAFNYDGTYVGLTFEF